METQEIWETKEILHQKEDLGIYIYTYMSNLEGSSMIAIQSPLTLPPTDLKKAKLQAQSKAPAKHPPDLVGGFNPFETY